MPLVTYLEVFFMSPIIDTLYSAWIGAPDPSRWPENLRASPVDGHGQYCFREGLRNH